MVVFLHLLLKEVWNSWVSFMSGIGLIIISFLGAYYRESLPPWAFWPAAAICFFFAFFWAAYLVYKRTEGDRKGLEDELIDATVLKYTLLDETGKDRLNREVSAIVQCIHGEGAKECGVLLYSSDPSLGHLRIALHCKGEVRPHSAKVSINAGEQRLFNVARINQETGQLEITAANADEVIAIPKRQYRVVLRAHAGNTPLYQDKTYILTVSEPGDQVFLYPVLDSDPERNLPPILIPERFAD